MKLTLKQLIKAYVELWKIEVKISSKQNEKKYVEFFAAHLPIYCKGGNNGKKRRCIRQVVEITQFGGGGRSKVDKATTEGKG